LRASQPGVIWNFEELLRPPTATWASSHSVPASQTAPQLGTEAPLFASRGNPSHRLFSKKLLICSRLTSPHLQRSSRPMFASLARRMSRPPLDSGPQPPCLDPPLDLWGNLSRPPLSTQGLSPHVWPHLSTYVATCLDPCLAPLSTQISTPWSGPTSRPMSQPRLDPASTPVSPLDSGSQRLRMA